MKKKTSNSFVPVAVVVGGMALCAIVFAQGGKSPVNSSNKSASAKAKDEPALVELAKTERKPLEFYTGTVRTNLFGAVPEVPKPKPVEIVAVPKVEPVKIDPFASLSDFAYTGTVAIGTEKMALIENTKTREGHFIKVGEAFSPIAGLTVTQIDERTVTVSLAGQTRLVSKSDTYNLTPLDKSAPFLTAGGPGQPGGPGAVPGAPGGAGGFGAFAGFGGPGGFNMQAFQNMTDADRQKMREQFMQNLSPEQRDRMQQRTMNRQFEGRGGGGGGGGRRGGGGGGGGFAGRMGFGG